MAVLCSLALIFRFKKKFYSFKKGFLFKNFKNIQRTFSRNLRNYLRKDSCKKYQPCLIFKNYHFITMSFVMSS